MATVRGGRSAGVWNVVLASGVVSGLVGFQATGAEPPARVDSLAWMAGAWSSTKAEVRTEEHWIAPAGGLMLGVNRTTRPNGRSSFEFLRIANTATGVSYFASPSGRPAVEFPLKESASERVLFENPQHDFPQRIRYWKEGAKTLIARIEGQINGSPRSMEWRWERE